MDLSGGIVGAKRHTHVCGWRGLCSASWITVRQDSRHRFTTRPPFQWRRVLLMVLAACLAATALWTAAWQEGQVGAPTTSRSQLDVAGGSRNLHPTLAAPMLQGCAHGSEIGQGTDFAAWYESDAKHLAELARRVSMQDRQSISEVETEIASIREKIAWLEANPSYSDLELGFSVYDTRTTGWLHVLSVAARVREELLMTRSEDAVPDANALYHLGDRTPLYEAAQDRLPEVAEVVDTLRGMDLPRAAFAEYRVYLLPFSMGDTSGLGARDYMLIGAPAEGRKVIENLIPVTVAHEFGHHIQLVSLGASYWDNPLAWQRYMNVRGIPRWSPHGEVNTAAWAASPEETFAEDVRVLFGPDRAASEPHGTRYGDPRTDPALAREIRKLVRAHAGAIREEAVAARESPWTSKSWPAQAAWANLVAGIISCKEVVIENGERALTWWSGHGIIKKRQR